MAVPKRRQSKSRSAIRRAQVMKQPVPNFVPCPRCGEPKLSHRVCAGCGYYRDRLVIEPKEEEQAVRPRSRACRASPSTRWAPTPRLASRSRASWPPCARAGIDVILVGDEARLRAELEGAGRRARAHRRAPRARGHHHGRPAVDGGQAEEELVDARLLRPGQGGRGRRGGLGRQLGRDDGLRAVRPGAAAAASSGPAIVTTFPTKAGECALLDMGANVDPKPAVLAQFAVLGVGLRAAAARQGAPQGGPAVERLRGAQGDAS